MTVHAITDFFKAGTTYILNKPYWAPEMLDIFQCEHVAPNPRNGEPRAFGFAKQAADDDNGWYSTALTPEHWAKGWVKYAGDDQAADFPNSDLSAEERDTSAVTAPSTEPLHR